MNSALRRRPIRVVDDFYKDPAAVVALEASLAHTPTGTVQPFAGSESYRSVASSKLVDRFSELAGEPLQSQPDRWVFGKFRRARPGDVGSTKVHVDPVAYTCIVYLSHEVSGGELCLYRHRSLDSKVTRDVNGNFVCGCCDSLSTFDARHVLPVTFKAQAWEMHLSIRPKFNRMVMLPGGDYFHGVEPVSGGPDGEPRLTQTFFCLGRES